MKEGFITMIRDVSAVAHSGGVIVSGTGNGSAQTRNAGNDASGDYSVAMGYGCTASGEYAVAMGYQCNANGDFSFADGSGCTANAAGGIAMGWGCTASGDTSVSMQGGPHVKGSIAMGRDCVATGEQSIAMGATCTTAAAQSIAMGARCNAVNNAAIAMGEGCSGEGWASIAMGEGCVADTSYAVAMGWSCKAGANDSTAAVALGYAAEASGSCGFMYKDTCGNKFCFDSGGGDGSGNIQINGHIVAGVGNASHAPLGTSLRVAYTTTVVNNQTLTSIADTFSDLPHDARSVSVTAWGPGGGSLCGGGVTFNIPSSVLRSWHWGGYQDTEAHFRLWQASEGVVGESVGYQWVVQGGGAAWATSNSTPADVGITNEKLWNYPGGAGGGLGKVPGAASNQANLADANTLQNAGIKVQWIE